MEANQKVRWAAAAGLMAATLLLSGCVEDTNKQNPYAKLVAREQPTPKPVAMIDPTAVPVRDDISGIQQIWPIMPWLRDTSTGKPVGFRCLVYFVSRQTEKGAFVSGPIVITLSEIISLPGGDAERRPLHTWELDQAAATGFRVRKLAVGGYYYGFILRWPDQLKLAGKRVEVQLSYKRGDGTLVSAAPHSMQVVGAAATTPPGTVRATQ